MVISFQGGPQLISSQGINGLGQSPPTLNNNNIDMYKQQDIAEMIACDF